MGLILGTQACSIFKNEYCNIFPEAQEQDKNVYSHTFIQCSTGSSSQGSKARKGNIRHIDWKGRKKIFLIVYIENTKESTKYEQYFYIEYFN